MESEEEAPIPNNSFGRQQNSRHVHYADSSITSSNSDELDKCLDEAINIADDDEDGYDDDEFEEETKYHSNERKVSISTK